MDFQSAQRRLQAMGIQDSHDIAFNALMLNETVLEEVFALHHEREKEIVGNRFNVKKLQAILLSKGIRVSDDDPLFTLLGLYRIAADDLAYRYERKFRALAGVSQSTTKIASPLLMAAIALGSFALGTLPKGDLSWLQGAAIFGEALLLLGLLRFLKATAKPAPHLTVPKLPSSEVQKPEENRWKETDFAEAVTRLNPKLSERTANACRSALVQGEDYKDIARASAIPGPMLLSAIRRIEKARNHGTEI